MGYQKRRKKLRKVVKFFHRNQVKKYNGEPYIHHLDTVARLSDKYCGTVTGYEIGLCHDLLEDTKCGPRLLYIILIVLGYTRNRSRIIVDGVIVLTDVYTREAYPTLNRLKRKRLEAIKVAEGNAEVQTVKYCDITDNTSNILMNDKKFAKVYLPEKEYMLTLLTKGNKYAYKIALQSAQSSETW